jgi:sulfonate transport system substrate-binding protein
MHRSRRLVLQLGAAAPWLLSGVARAATTGQSLRIGYQKSGTLAVLRETPELAPRLAALHVALDWVEFQSGPPLLEALNAGSIDFGTTGDTPPIFAQAAGANLVYVGHSPNAGSNHGLLVRADTPFQTVADLKDKSVAFTKGSAAQIFLVKALATAGLSYADIKPVFLQPADAAAAFRRGAVDAWAIWDPFYAQTELSDQVRVLLTGDKVSRSNSFFLAEHDYAEKHPDIVAAAINDLDEASSWSQQHQDEVAKLLSQVTGVSLAAEQRTVARTAYRVAFVTDQVVAQQQETADILRKLGMIPKAVAVREAVWTPPTQ